MTGFLLCSGKDLETGIDGERSLFDLPAGFGLVYKAAGDRAIFHGPFASIVRFFHHREINPSQAPIRSRGPRGKLQHRNPIPSGTPLTPTEVRRRFNIVVDEPVRLAYAEELVELRQQEAFWRAVLSRADGGLEYYAALGLAELRVSIEDPINLLSNLASLPPKVAIKLTRWAGRGGRIAVGAAEGLITGIAIESIVQAQAYSEGADLDLGDSLMALVGGVLISGGFGLTKGKLTQEQIWLSDGYAEAMRKGVILENQLLLDLLQAIDEVRGKPTVSPGVRTHRRGSGR